MMDQKELIETLAMFRDHAIKCKARSETYAMAQWTINIGTLAGELDGRAAKITSVTLS
jgi:hypothetical protein